MKKRLFIAIALPEAVIARMEELQKQLKPYARDAKWVNVRGIHLTLKFLGYVDPEQIPDIETALPPIGSSSTPIHIQTRGCGFFPNPRRPNILWVGIQAPDLLPVQVRVESAMEKLGFEKEDRAFHPHLTLARFKDSRGLLPFGREIEKIADQNFGEFTADHFNLYESILHRQGAEYIQLKSFSLTEAGKKREEIDI